MPLDYTTPAIDEMTDANHDGTMEMTGMTDKAAADKLKAAGWTIVETTGFMHLIGPLWERLVDGEHEYALITEDKHHNRRGLVQGGVLMTFADRTCGMTARYRLGQADARDRAARHAFRRGRQDRRDPDLEAARGALDPQPDFHHHRGDRRQALYRDGERRVQDIEERVRGLPPSFRGDRDPNAMRKHVEDSGFRDSPMRNCASEIDRRRSLRIASQ